MRNLDLEQMDVSTFSKYKKVITRYNIIDKNTHLDSHNLSFYSLAFLSQRERGAPASQLVRVGHCVKIDPLNSQLILTCC